MEIHLLILFVFLAVFTQSLAGFGVALVAMSLLPGLVGIRIAVPLVAILALTLEVVLSILYRDSFDIKSVWPIALASIVGIPFGVWTFKGVDELLLTRLLGFLISAYAIYSLLKFRLPNLRQPVWGVATGFLAGILGGAYNIAGPPYVIYGTCRRWPLATFKGNLQGLFVINSLFVFVSHFASGNITTTVWEYYLRSLPALILGIIAGTSLDHLISPDLFRKLVLALLIVLGIRLING
jgi:hypothetical protein